MRSLHPLRSRFLTVFAVLVLVLGTAAPALARMTCVMSGRSVLSIGQAGDCCPVKEADKGMTVKATCCELTSTQPQRSAFLGTPSVELAPLMSIAVPVPLLTCIGMEIGDVDEARCTRPPPLLGGRRLATIGCFLI